MDFMLTVSGVVILSIAYTADKYGCHLLSRIGAYCSLMLIFSSLFFELVILIITNNFLCYFFRLSRQRGSLYCRGANGKLMCPVTACSVNTMLLNYVIHTRTLC